MGAIKAVVCLLLLLLIACEEEPGPTQQPKKTNEELIAEKFETFKKGFQQGDINTIMSVIADDYWTEQNESKEALKNWLLSFWAGKEWNPDSVKMTMTSDIRVTPGWLDPELQELHPATARLDFELFFPVKDPSKDHLISILCKLRSNWELGAAWGIRKLFGPVAHVITSPISVSTDSTVSLQLYTLPFGAPLESYDTKSATVSDWRGNPISIIDEGNRYTGTFTAPSNPGSYTLTASLSDTTYNKTVELTHTFTVE